MENSWVMGSKLGVVWIAWWINHVKINIEKFYQFKRAERAREAQGKERREQLNCRFKKRCRRNPWHWYPHKKTTKRDREGRNTIEKRDREVERETEKLRDWEDEKTREIEGGRREKRGKGKEADSLPRKFCKRNTKNEIKKETERKRMKEDERSECVCVCVCVWYISDIFLSSSPSLLFSSLFFSLYWCS